MNIGIIGVGKWGKKLLKVFNKISTVKMCANKSNIEGFKEEYPNTKFTLDYKDILNDKTVDAVVIAVPINLLSKIAIESLEAGKHVFLEKPMAQNTEDAEELLELANDKVLFIGYIFLHHPVYSKLKTILSKDPPDRIDTIWNRLGSFNTDILLNHTSHEIAILLDLFETNPTNVKIVYKEEVISEIDNIKIDLDFNNNKSGTININRSHPIKNKEVRVRTEGGKLYHWINNSLFELNIKENSFELIFETKEESLDLECQEFLNCIEENKKPISNGKLGLNILDLINKLK